MEPHDESLMTPFDHLTSSQELQTLKVFIPYTPPMHQEFLAVYVKFMELQRTLSVFRNSGNSIHAQAFEKGNASPLGMLREIRPYLPTKTGETFDTVMNMMNMMEVVSSFQDMNQPSDTSGNNVAFNPMDMMKGMLSPEQQEMFGTYSTMFSEGNMSAQESVDVANIALRSNHEINSSKKGYENNGHEYMDESSDYEEYGPSEIRID